MPVFYSLSKQTTAHTIHSDISVLIFPGKWGTYFSEENDSKRIYETHDGFFIFMFPNAPRVVTNLAIQVLRVSHSQLLLPKLFSKVVLNSVGAVSTVLPQTFILPLSLSIKRFLSLLAASFRRFSLVSLPPVSCPLLQLSPFQFLFFNSVAMHMDLISTSVLK